MGKKRETIFPKQWQKKYIHIPNLIKVDPLVWAVLYRGQTTVKNQTTADIIPKTTLLNSEEYKTAISSKSYLTIKREIRFFPAVEEKDWLKYKSGRSS